MTSIPQTSKITRITVALPFWLSLGLVPLAIFAAMQGGWAIALLPLSTWYLFTGLDYVVGKNTENPDPETPAEQLFWYRLITLLWPPLQLITIFGIMIYVVQTDHLARVEEWLLFAALGILSGTIGITYAHELMHQKPKLERWMADILLGSVLYSHFRSEHLLVHHRYVGTPRDPDDSALWRKLLPVFRTRAASVAGVVLQSGKSHVGAQILALVSPIKPFLALSRATGRICALGVDHRGMVGRILVCNTGVLGGFPA